MPILASEALLSENKKCNHFIQCTGVAVESLRESGWCCFFTENPIVVKSGTNVLIHKPEVQTGCLFGFDPEGNCSQCLATQRYDLELTYLSDGQSRNDVFLNIVLSGDLCTRIGGTFIHPVLIFQFNTAEHRLGSQSG